MNVDLHIASLHGFTLLQDLPYNKSLQDKIDYLAGMGLSVTTTATKNTKLSDAQIVQTLRGLSHE